MVQPGGNQTSRNLAAQADVEVGRLAGLWRSNADQGLVAAGLSEYMNPGPFFQPVPPMRI